MNNKIRKLTGFYFKSLCKSFNLYLLLSLCIGVMVFYIKSRFEEVNYETALVMSDPYQIPVMVMIIISGIFLSISVLLSISRERMSGVMEVLFYTPIKTTDYLGGYLLSHLGAFILMAGIFILSMFSTQVITNIAFTYKSFLYFGASLPMISCCIGMGMFFASMSKNQRNALVYFFLIVFFFIGIQIGTSVVSSAVATQEILDLVFLRNTLEKINTGIAFLNPVACFISVADEYLSYDYRGALFSILRLVLLSAFWFFISIKAIQKRGVVSE